MKTENYFIRKLKFLFQARISDSFKHADNFIQARDRNLYTYKI